MTDSRNDACHRLTYDSAADDWNGGLPLGNGRLGAMSFGGALTPRFGINDATAWSGSVASAGHAPRIDAAGAAEALGAARLAITEDRYADAEAALRLLQHRHSQSFLPVADLQLRIGDGTDAVLGYRRELDLDSATLSATVTTAESKIRVTAFVSPVTGVLEIRLAVDGQPISLGISLQTPLSALDGFVEPGVGGWTFELPSDVVPPHDEATYAIRYGGDSHVVRGAVVVGLSADGEVTGEARGEWSVNGTTSVRLVLATETTFAGVARFPEGTVGQAADRARERVLGALDVAADDAWDDHVGAHRRLYRRSALDVPGGEGSTTEARIASWNEEDATPDPALIALASNYGRYLLIASSRPGSPPANLQGIWNNELRPVWSSNYTTNINVQMNYWAAHPTGLAECAEPLNDLVVALSRTGAETAQRLYASPGWVAHHNTDVWAYSEPVGNGIHEPKWAFWPLAGLWLCTHLWRHYEYTGDIESLRSEAFPVLRGAAEFALSWLQLAPDGRLDTIPSTSPENEFFGESGRSQVGVSSALDIQLIRAVFEDLAAAAAVLGIEPDDVLRRATHARAQLRETRIGDDGLIEEWPDATGYPDPQHRHLSPVFDVYPRAAELSQALVDGTRALLDERGDESTGWSLAWKLALRAKLRDRHRLDNLLRLYFRDMTVDRGPWVGGIYPNLLCAHPPFQIDGNCGFVAAVVEMLVDDRGARAVLLPALPAAMPDGAATGLVLKSGLTLDLTWAAGALDQARLTNPCNGDILLTVEFEGCSSTVVVAPGQTVAVHGKPAA